MLDIKLLGERIKTLRGEKGLTQKEFADMLNVSYQAVSNWERAIAPPELDNLIRIAKSFGVLVDDLLRPVGEKLILGVDGGGTKTEFVVATTKGKVLGGFFRDGCNPNDGGMQRALGIICDGIGEALLKYPSVASVFLGVAGVSSGENRQRMLEYLKDKYPMLKIDIKNDASLLFAVDDGADMTIISGTGSVAFVKNKKEYIRIGGWGYLFDSAGSAYNIGKDAVYTALAEEDSKENHSFMSNLLKKKLNVDKFWDAVPTLYEKGRPYIASLATVVFEAYKAGDKKAIDIVDRNAARLGELLNIGRKIYKARPKAVAGGGIFEHNSDVIMSHIAKYTDTEIVICPLPPVYGACLMSCRLLGEDAGNDFYDNFKKSYRER